MYKPYKAEWALKVYFAALCEPSPSPSNNPLQVVFIDNQMMEFGLVQPGLLLQPNTTLVTSSLPQLGIKDARDLGALERSDTSISLFLLGKPLPLFTLATYDAHSTTPLPSNLTSCTTRLPT